MSVDYVIRLDQGRSQRPSDAIVGAPARALGADADQTADWWILGWNEWWSALLGDPAAVCEHERNLVWQVFAGDDWRPLPKDRSLYEFKLALANDLRRQSIAFPHDAQLHRLITTLRDGNDEFAGMWQRTTAARHGAERKTLRHPVGDMVLDADVLQMQGTSQNLVVYSVRPGTADAATFAPLSPGAERG